jgi:hypothetical protein
MLLFSILDAFILCRKFFHPNLTHMDPNARLFKISVRIGEKLIERELESACKEELDTLCEELRQVDSHAGEVAENFCRPVWHHTSKTPAL